MLSIARLCLALITLLAAVALAAPLPAPAGPPPPSAKALGKRPAPQSATPPPAKRPATSAGTKTIIVGGTTYALGEVLGKGKVGTVYSTSQGKVAKQFAIKDPRIKASYDDESANTAAVLGQRMSKGESRIGGGGDAFGWIISLLVPGQPLHKTAGLKANRAKGRSVCQDYLMKIVYPEFQKKFLALHASSKLVHLDPHMGNAMWDPTGKVLNGFIDYDQMDKVDGPKYKIVAKRLTGTDTPVKVEKMAELFAHQEYKLHVLC